VQVAFETAYRQRGPDDGGPRESSFVVQETESILTVTPLGLTHEERDWQYFFPQAAGADAQGYPIESLMAIDAPTVKQGMHHIDGLLAFYGVGVRSGVQLPNCTNLDVAPTLLALMDVAVPAVMEGQVLGCTEALAARAYQRLSRSRAPARPPAAAATGRRRLGAPDAAGSGRARPRRRKSAGRRGCSRGPALPG
jgi:hypothetical protein